MDTRSRPPRWRARGRPDSEAVASTHHRPPPVLASGCVPCLVLTLFLMARLSCCRPSFSAFRVAASHSLGGAVQAMLLPVSYSLNNPLPKPKQRTGLPPAPCTWRANQRPHLPGTPDTLLATGRLRRRERTSVHSLPPAVICDLGRWYCTGQHFQWAPIPLQTPKGSTVVMYESLTSSGHSAS